ncbi:MAG: acetylxylan esterase [Candidatus Hydrogenedentes bacterium]|nr:acetylxylan esterase [Candidatus Hydrogenedentota bacterium]
MPNARFLFLSRTAAVLCFAVSALTAPAQNPPEPNLLPNPGFESADGWEPAQWGRRTPSDMQRALSWDSTVQRSGERSLKIENRVPDLSRWRTGHLCDLGLEPGTEYALSGWIRAQLAQGSAFLRLYCMAADGTILAQPASSKVSAASEWTEVHLEGRVPAGTAYAMVYLELDGVGAAWYDDLCLTGTPCQVAPGVARGARFTYAASDAWHLEGYALGRREEKAVFELPRGAAEGCAEVRFYGETARYHLILSYLHESAGDSDVTVRVNDREVGLCRLDETPEAAGAHGAFREIRFPDVDIQRGSRVVLHGRGGRCRVHAVAFEPAGGFQGERLPDAQLAIPPTLRIHEEPIEQARVRSTLPHFIGQAVERATETRNQELAGLDSPEAWRRRQQAIRARLPEYFGDFSPKCPLNPRIARTLDRPGYTIENVIFESQPGFYCVANLYVPKERAFPVPGILFTCGHAGEGKAYHLYHEACLGLVLKGYVVLGLDPIGQGERNEYFDPDTGETTVPVCVSQHHYLNRPSWLVGRALSGYRTWDCIRAVDYLASRPEVDPERLGVIGNSGGGQMALLIAAADERIKVCAAAHPGGSMENSYLLGRGLIDHEILGLIPPRPCAFIVGRDSGEESGHRRRFDDMLRFYEGFGVSPDRAQFFLVDGVHNMERPKREAAYAWVNRWFDKEAEGADEPPLAPESVEDLQCTPSGSVVRDLNSETGQTLNARRAAFLRTRRPAPPAAPDIEQWRSSLRPAIARRVGLTVPAAREVPRSMHTGAFDTGEFASEKIVIEPEPGIELPALIITPKQAPARLPVVLHAAEYGKPRHPDGECIALSLARAGYAVCSIDVRGAGELDPRGAPEARSPLTRFDYPQFRVEAAAMDAACLDTTLPAMRAFDLIRALDYLAQREGFAGQPIALVGEGLGGVWALLAGAFDERPAAVLCVGTVPSYELIVQAQYYRCREYFWINGALEEFDLPDLISLIAPRPVTLIEPLDAMLEPLDEARCRDACAGAATVFAALDASPRFRIQCGGEGRPGPVAARVAALLDELGR